jgi:hypothetical protein
VTTPAVPEQTDETGFPQAWIFGEDGDLVTGGFVRFDEGPTRDYGTKVILVLEVDGVERSVWLSVTALFSRVRGELNRRTSKTLDLGERVVIQRHEKKQSKNDREYWPFTIAFPDRPQKSTSDLFELDEGLVRNEETAKGDVGPDGDIPF